MNELFRKFAQVTSRVVGSSWAFILAVIIIIAWAASGPMFHFSDTWQLVINTGTTIITFLMVFLIQNTQNRDAKAIHLKLDELIRAIAEARTGLVDLEDLSDADLERLRDELKHVGERAREEKPDDSLVEAIEQEQEERADEGAPREPAPQGAR